MVKPSRATEILARLKGRKYLLMGNHDYFAREKQFDPSACGIEWVKMYHELKWEGRTYFHFERVFAFYDKYIASNRENALQGILERYYFLKRLKYSIIIE